MKVEQRGRPVLVTESVGNTANNREKSIASK